MSKLAEIKRRLEAARGLEWHAVKLARWEDGHIDYGIAPSPLERTHFSKGDVEFMVAAREYVALLLAVVDEERGLKTPQAVADQWRRIAAKTRPADDVLAALFDEKADAWEAIA